MLDSPSHIGAPPSRRDVWKMFDRIAGRYDLLNRCLSLRQDVAWRKALGRRMPDRESLRILDLATGTGDVLLALAKSCRQLHTGVGLDMSGGMLDQGRTKIRQRRLDGALSLVRGDACELAVADNVFDAVTIAFGIRNVLHTETALQEMRRVLKPGGRALILEFSIPANPVFRAIYLWYFRRVLPRLGGMISGDGAAYRYLNETVETYPYGEAFCRLMREAGFAQVSATPLSLGIATLYQGDK